MSATTYRVTCEQDEDGWWVGRVEGVKGVVTQGRSLATIRERIREALSLAVDDADTAEIVLAPKVPDKTTAQAFERYTRALEALANAKLEAEEAASAAARELSAKMSMRDAGVLLNMTGSRVQQLAQPPSRPRSDVYAAKKSPRWKGEKDVHVVTGSGEVHVKKGPTPRKRLKKR